MQSSAYQSLLDQCIHCGLCLPACPTYQLFFTEMESPRGRIQLMQAAADGRIGTDGALREHLDLCLGCRACETACPSGVQYGALLEVARADMEAERPRGLVEMFSRRLALREMLPHRERLRILARLLALYQRLGLNRLLQKLTILPDGLRTMAELLPPIHTGFVDASRPAPAMEPRQGTVAFFHGCVQDAFLAGVNAATVRVLQRNGYEVHFPGHQSCCGAAALHIGEAATARDLARRNVDAVNPDWYDAIINNAGGCGATLKEYGHLLAGDPAYAQRAAAFAAKVQDITEFLAANLHTPPTRALPLRVIYADSCHLRHGQKVVSQPRQLLQSIPGLTLRELQRPDLCCGSAGLYNIMQAATADQVLDAKLADLQATGADVVVTTNTGCHMQYLYGVRRAGLSMRVAHVVELLDQAYG